MGNQVDVCDFGLIERLATAYSDPRRRTYADDRYDDSREEIRRSSSRDEKVQLATLYVRRAGPKSP